MLVRKSICIFRYITLVSNPFDKRRNQHIMKSLKCVHEYIMGWLKNSRIVQIYTLSHYHKLISDKKHFSSHNNFFLLNSQLDNTSTRDSLHQL